VAFFIGVQRYVSRNGNEIGTGPARIERAGA
jgi:hypothetical protein